MKIHVVYQRERRWNLVAWPTHSVHTESGALQMLPPYLVVLSKAMVSAERHGVPACPCYDRLPTLSLGASASCLRGPKYLRRLLLCSLLVSVPLVRSACLVSAQRLESVACVDGPWQTPFAGIRVGEAQHPGPFRIRQKSAPPSASRDLPETLHLAQWQLCLIHRHLSLLSHLNLGHLG